MSGYLLRHSKGRVGILLFFVIVYITVDLKEKANEYREKLIEKTVEEDDAIMESYLDGNEPSNLEFGMNFGLNLMLNTSLGLTMKYNIIEEKQDDVQSLSLNGLSFGIILK